MASLEQTVRDGVEQLLGTLADGAEESAKVAAACALETTNDGQDEYFRGWRAAMLAVAAQCRSATNGTATVIPLRRPR